MKPDWDKLGKSFADSENLLIVDVDCTADGQGTCQRMGVQGYPTIKYFTEKTGKSGAAYNGGRDFNSMKAFADKTLNTASCDVTTKKGCLPNELTYIEKNEAKTMEELQTEMSEKEEALKELKKERSAAQAEMREKEKAWTKKEKLLKKASGILKQLEKKKGGGGGAKPKAKKAPPKEEMEQEL